MKENTNLEVKEQTDDVGRFERVVTRKPPQDLFGNVVIKSIGYDETEMITNILHLHSLNNEIDLDPTYSKGNFYKKGIKKPKYKFDLNPQVPEVQKADAGNLPFGDNELLTIMFDPPFLFRDRKAENNDRICGRFSYFQTFEELLNMYERSLKEFYRILKPKGIVVFKCQDMTDDKTYFTHNEVLRIANSIGFLPLDLFILLSKMRLINKEQKQRYARKYHSYYWVFRKQVQKRFSV